MEGESWRAWRSSSTDTASCRLSRGTESLSVAAIDTQLRTSDRIFDLVLREHVHHSSRMKRIRNSHLAIHKLPLELFVNVLLWTIDTIHWRIEYVHTLAQVCVYWRDTILTTAAFWPLVDVTYGLQNARTVLQRNPAGPITVSLHIEKDDMVEVLKLTAKHSHRWRTIRVAIECPLEALALLQCPAPKLQDLCLWTHNIPQGNIFEIPQGATLRHVDVEIISLRWTSPQLSGLSSLQIKDLEVNVPSAHQIHTILSASPGLSRLILTDLRGKWFPEDEEPISSDAELLRTPIHLPCLETVCFGSLPPSLHKLLLSTVQAPNATSVSICDPIPPASSPSVLLRQTFENATEVQIICAVREGLIYASSIPSIEAPWYMINAGEPDEEGFSVALSLDTLSSLPDGLRVDSCVQLEIDNGVGGAIGGLCPWETLLLTFPWITTLKLGDRPLLPVLSYLSQPQPLPNDPQLTRWPCPRLRKLDVSDASSYGRHDPLPNAVAKLVMARKDPSESLENGIDIVVGGEEIAERVRGFVREVWPSPAGLASPSSPTYLATYPDESSEFDEEASEAGADSSDELSSLISEVAS